MIGITLAQLNVTIGDMDDAKRLPLAIDCRGPRARCALGALRRSLRRSRRRFGTRAAARQNHDERGHGYILKSHFFWAASYT